MKIIIDYFRELERLVIVKKGMLILMNNKNAYEQIRCFHILQNKKFKWMAIWKVIVDVMGQMQSAKFGYFYFQVNVFDVQILVSLYMQFIQVASIVILNLLLLYNHQLVLWIHKHITLILNNHIRQLKEIIKIQVIMKLQFKMMQHMQQKYVLDAQDINNVKKGFFFFENSYSYGIYYGDSYLGNENLKCPNCKDALDTKIFLWCSHCEDNQIQQNNECVSCGMNCDSCDSKENCNFCIGDPSKYYLSINGRNCIECNIENCRYCFQYVVISGQYYTTLDFNFNIQNFQFKLCQFWMCIMQSKLQLQPKYLKM
ncbi:unnamed protein product [Paramecium pentaurelia]|uniref:Transmembrane protein n=1 Tax=Paramecium pentaurelia TaxID=43138 RepID=A0A8S1VRD1_9CILI|nr:unnamed protein product [Paramecium pentaurelia]